MGGNQLILEYRTVDGGITTTTLVAIMPSVQPFLKIQKVGTTYTAFYSIDGGLNYTSIGTGLALGFGGGGVSVGDGGVTSTDNSVASTDIFDNFSEGNSPLPVTLVDFTGNKYQQRLYRVEMGY